MSLAAMAAYDGESERAVLDRLLHHVSQRFRLSYVLGAVDFEDADNDELSEGSPAERGDYDLTETRQLLRSTVKRLRQIAQDHAPGLRKELDEAESDEIVREELFEDSFDSLLRGDDRFQILVEDLMDEIQRRFDLLPGGDLAKTKQGWPRSWAYESEDRETFLTVISRFTSNYARRFGSLLTPLVSGIRIAGPFSPKWTDRQPKLVLVDGEGLGHTPDPAASLPTAVTARFDHIDAVASCRRKNCRQTGTCRIAAGLRPDEPGARGKAGGRRISFGLAGEDGLESEVGSHQGALEDHQSIGSASGRRMGRRILGIESAGGFAQGHAGKHLSVHAEPVVMDARSTFRRRKATDLLEVC